MTRQKPNRTRKRQFPWVTVHAASYYRCRITDVLSPVLIHTIYNAYVIIRIERENPLTP